VANKYPTECFRSWLPLLLAGFCLAFSANRATVASDLITPKLSIPTSHASNTEPQSWQSAVVSLRVPTRRLVNGERSHHEELCSGTVISHKPTTVLTAWHCFDGYDDLSNPPMVLINGLWHQGRLRQHGKSMRADWAILTVKGNHDVSRVNIDTSSQYLQLGRKIIVAGFDKTDAGERQLIIEHDCTIAALAEQWISSDCSAKRGASGGPILVRDGPTFAVIGVISALRNEWELLFAPIRGISTRVD